MGTILELHQLDSFADVLKIRVRGKSGMMRVLNLWAAVPSCVEKAAEEMNINHGGEREREMVHVSFSPGFRFSQKSCLKFGYLIKISPFQSS